ncbi:MAG TPA: AAA family ATPase, partial [Candidatus Limnocylindrales bacterium]
MNDTNRELRSLSDALDGRTTSEAVLFEIRRVIVGQDAMLERVLVALLAGGHLLLEGVPGLAKTLTVKTLADVLDASFRRIQFTPDLVPADLVGTRIYRPDRGTFDTELGPVFANFLLADEINRAPAKVQSALLEVMQERQVTIGPETFAVPRPFLVMATQNPIESEGTYPLPEAQVDRFMMKVVVGYPSAGEEAVVVERSLRPAPEVTSILTAEGLSELQALTARVYVDRSIVDYAVALTAATRNPEQ